MEFYKSQLRLSNAITESLLNTLFSKLQNLKMCLGTQKRGNMLETLV